MRIERLVGHYELGTFHCGVKSLDDWLAVHALENQRRNLSRTFLLVDDTDEVLGYYSLTMGGVHHDDLPRRHGRGLPDYDIGMALLARLAVAEHRQGDGLGRDLLIEALERAALAGDHAAARFIAVDGINSDAAASIGDSVSWRFPAMRLDGCSSGSTWPTPPSIAVGFPAYDVELLPCRWRNHRGRISTAAVNASTARRREP